MTGRARSEGLPPDFFGMTKRQARQYLDVFLDELPASRERLARMLVKAGADPRLADDLGPKSLDPLWEVATRAWDLSWQSDYVPGRTTADPPVRFPTLAALGPLDRLPSWFRHGPTHYLRFSPDTLWVIDVLGRHLGQCLIATHPGVEWVPGPGAPRHHSHERNWPLVGSGIHWASPLGHVSGLVGGQTDGLRPVTPAWTLRTAFDRMSETLDLPGPGDDEPVTVHDLTTTGALGVRALDHEDADDRELLKGGFQYVVWVGDEARLFYDDDAPLGLDAALAARPGIVAVDWQDRELLHVKAPRMTADGVLEAVAEALRDPRVRTDQG